MRHESYHGYIISADEVAVILAGIGCKDMRGLPVSANVIDKERQTDAIRRLCKKNILEWNDGGYRLKPLFAKVFTGMKKCRRVVMLISKSYPGQGFVCYGVERGLAVWETSLYREDMLTLYYTSPEGFIEMLSEDGFIPDIPEYCGEIPESFGEEIEESYRRLREGINASKVRIAFAAVARDIGSVGETEIFMVSCSIYGSIITKIKDGIKENCIFDREQFIERIKQLMKCEEEFL